MNGPFCIIVVNHKLISVSLSQAKSLCPEEFQAMRETACQLKRVDNQDDADIREAQRALNQSMAKLRNALVAKLDAT